MNPKYYLGYKELFGTNICNIIIGFCDDFNYLFKEAIKEVKKKNKNALLYQIYIDINIPIVFIYYKDDKLVMRFTDLNKLQDCNLSPEELELIRKLKDEYENS